MPAARSSRVTVAARMGGGDPNFNPRLRLAIDKAKEENMPADNLDRAIKRGTGELEGVSYEEIRYEGYGPGGVPVIVDCLTDNRVRTVADVRHAFSKHGGNMAMRKAPNYLKSINEGFQYGAASEQHAKTFNHVRGPRGEIGECSLAYLTV